MGRPRPSRKLRIAVCHPDLGIGGAERVVVDAAMELKALGHEVHVFTAHRDRKHCFEETLGENFPVTVYGDFLPRNIFNRLYALCAYVRCLYVAFCMIFLWPAFDVVFVDQVSAIIPILKFNTSSKVLFYCHFPDLLLAKHTTFLRKLYRKPIDMLEEMTTGEADRVLVNSEFTALTFQRTFKSLDRKGIVPSVLYPAVNIDQFGFWDKTPSNGHGAQMPTFLTINRFERKKNIGLAISAFALVARHQASLKASKGKAEIAEVSPGLDAPDVRLVIAGGYDELLTENREHLQELKALAVEEGVSNWVDFEPSCSTSRKNSLLNTCICVIYTPTEEHFGIVPLEAMAAKKPVIACNSGGPKESVQHNVTGFLCEPSAPSFAAAMRELLRDPNKAETMGMSARNHVENNFSRKVFGEKLNMIIQDLLE